LESFRGKHVLLLQGPMGPFFRHISQHLQIHGAFVSKVNFNLADSAYFAGSAKSHLYCGKIENWPDYFERLIVDSTVGAVVLFGDCRPYHQIAIDRARKLGIDIYVFEEGYLRPDFVTFEKDGVNGHSSLPRKAEFYHALETHPLPVPLPVGNVYAWGVLHSIIYSALATLFWWRCPNYRHHRDINCFRQGIIWLRGGLRRFIHAIRDRQIRTSLEEGNFPPYFLVPLQVHLDSQIAHSDFRDVTDFIKAVIESFVLNAPTECTLILKDHPLDRAYRDYSQLVNQLRNEHKLGQRLLYADVINLPSALRHARGTVVINSTVGLSSICHHTPTKCLGNAVYDIEGLTHQGSLDSFWFEPAPINQELVEKFRFWLRKSTQLNGSIWKMLFRQ
jgi:capsule polysaccharide modification protein KpsS